MRTSNQTRAAAAFAVLAMMAIACGDEGGTEGEDESTEATAEPEEEGTEATAEPEEDYEYSFQVAHYVAENTAHHQALELWAEEVISNAAGTVDIEVFPLATLAAADDTLPAVRERRIDIGFSAAFYHPDELPLSAVTEIPFVTGNSEAMMRTLHDLYSSNEEFRQEWHDAGVHVLQFMPVTPSLFGAIDETIASVSDLQGTSIRALGNVAEVLDAANANVVGIAFPEIYESLQRGVIDAYSGVVLDAGVGAGFHEVAPYVSQPGIGLFTVHPLLIAKDTWDELPSDLQNAMSDATDTYMNSAAEIQLQVDGQACDTLLEAGGSMMIWDEADTEELSETLGDRIYTAWEQRAEDSGADAASFFEAYESLLRDYELEAADVTSGAEECAARS